GRKPVAGFRVKESDLMRDTRHTVRPAPLAAFFALTTISAAILTTSHAFAQGPGGAILAPRTTVHWSIQSAAAPPMNRMNGQSIVGPDGRILVGPYGAVQVQGLTVAQAEKAVEKQLGTYLPQPKVGLRLEDDLSFPEAAPIITLGRVVPLGDSP